MDVFSIETIGFAQQPHVPMGTYGGYISGGGGRKRA